LRGPASCTRAKRMYHNTIHYTTLNPKQDVSQYSTKQYRPLIHITIQYNRPIHCPANSTRGVRRGVRRGVQMPVGS